MTAGKELDATDYIQHHLTFLTEPVSAGGFWSLNVDSLVTSVLLGAVALGFLWWVVRGATAGVPGRRQAFVELLIGFIDDQVKSVFHHGDRNRFVAPAALTLSVWVLMIGFSIAVKGLGGWIHELFCAPFGANPLLWPANFLFNLVEYVSKPL